MIEFLVKALGVLVFTAIVYHLVVHFAGIQVAFVIGGMSITWALVAAVVSFAAAYKAVS